MALDSDFRSRLRDALRHSAVGAPAGADQPTTVGEKVQSGLPGHTAVVRELRYDAEDERARDVASSQAAWIADMLGGDWQHDGDGVCLVVDRVFDGDLRHGDASIGDYAQALVLHGASLSRLNLREPPQVPS